MAKGIRRHISQLKKRDWIFSSSTIFLYSGWPSMDWMAHTQIGKGGSFLLSLLIQMLISSGNTLKDSPEIMFCQLSGYPLTQSSWYIKLIITVMNSDDVSNCYWGPELLTDSCCCCCCWIICGDKQCSRFPKTLLCSLSNFPSHPWNKRPVLVIWTTTKTNDPFVYKKTFTLTHNKIR